MVAGCWRVFYESFKKWLVNGGILVNRLPRPRLVACRDRTDPQPTAELYLINDWRTTEGDGGRDKTNTGCKDGGWKRRRKRGKRKCRGVKNEGWKVRGRKEEGIKE